MSSGSPLPFSHAHCGVNAGLSMDGLTASRVKSYNQAIVVSAAPLEDNHHYQVEVKELNVKRYSGCLRIGVTSLPLETVSGWKRWGVKNDTSGNTTALDMTDDGQLCICSGGEKITVQDCHIDLSSLEVGESLGVVCVPPHYLKFTVNGREIRSHSRHLSHHSPGPRFLFVDVYGPVSAVEALPVELRERGELRVAGLPGEIGRAGGGSDCRYFELCHRFLWAQRGSISDSYFSWEHSKCYCEDCYSNSLPGVKRKGLPAMEYTVPSGWVKFGISLPKRAEVLDMFRDWHVCYHGTPVDRVADILDCGQLMIRGDRTLPDREPVPCPPNHFNKSFRPEGYNLEQIFLSPSLHYCTHGEVYAGSIRCVDSQCGKRYTAKVAFQLRIHPQAYTISPQTTQRSDTRIDPHIPNERIEWQTVFRSSTILTALCVRLSEDS